MDVVISSLPAWFACPKIHGVFETGIDPRQAKLEPPPIPTFIVGKTA
jgi:hypothetical protein